jgi:hypothetical protein
MADSEDKVGSVQALRDLLPQLPLDADQRATVSHNLDFVDEAEVHAVLQELRRSFSSLHDTFEELNSIRTSSSVEIIADPIPAQVYQLSAGYSASAEQSSSL